MDCGLPCAYARSCHLLPLFRCPIKARRAILPIFHHSLLFSQHLMVSGTRSEYLFSCTPDLTRAPLLHSNNLSCRHYLIPPPHCFALREALLDNVDATFYRFTHRKTFAKNGLHHAHCATLRALAARNPRFQKICFCSFAPLIHARTRCSLPTAEGR